MATIQLEGIPFESESKKSLEAAFLTVRGVFNQLATKYGGRLAVWTHIVKTEDELSTKYDFSGNQFMQTLSDKYIGSFSGSTFFSTSYYITLVYQYDEALNLAVNEFEEVLRTVTTQLKRFNSHMLGVNDDGSSCSNVEFLSQLLNNNRRSIPMVENKIKDIIGHSDWHFGYDTLEIRNADTQTSKYAVFYEVDSMPATTEMGMWDFLLTQQCEFVITQSMFLFKAPKTIRILEEQMNQIESTDANHTELLELEIAKDAVVSGNACFGDYHCSIAVFNEDQALLVKKASEFAGEFGARNTLLKRSNLKSAFSFLSALPASKERITPSPRTTANLASTFSIHNYSKGKQYGNPIGDGTALMPLKTLSDTIFHLNCHASEPGKNVVGKKYAGHVMLLGASGAGKTTTEGVLVGFLTRWNPQIFAIDYNRSTELFIRAYGGQYFCFDEGVDSGLNPFQLEDTPSLRSFLNRLCYRLCSNNEGFLSELEEMEVKAGIDSVMLLDHEHRGLSALLSTIQQPSLRARLSKWCHSEGGQYAWCLDSPLNKFNPETMDKIGFDTTLLLDDGGHPACEAVLATLFYIKELMQKEGRLLCTIVEEFWMPANYPLTQNLMKKVLKAGRLKSEFMILSSQSPEDAIDCKIFAPIVQQTATKIFLPNPDAEFESYQKCGLSYTEFKELSLLDKQSRIFLVKQSHNSCFARLDLHGYDNHLPIISGTTEDISLCEEIRQEHGDKPDVWIPLLLQAIKEREEKKSEKVSNSSGATSNTSS
ncbi:conjugal transfer protein TraE (plasmid) [Vibrio tubiashii ATCC 19109]|uniref:Conjugal transfer protein TraE n=1 Tax=Vibrio tubiashii ATCC 19109 TaxID=1051646 RepID=F9T6N6_9VIBR|nr:VirB4 family type IV secretion system protein [Vibrio tubiashii]AIW17512.1 conjugal transfer protein TraE [Vibrio tubiashii ATCC 19109]EGU54441.1 conjugal transfer protein TraE [Vibrio tubiashii ATCC 19109]EIF01283.1 conjugal transfer protein TraE [Vibrio tubiashii NCIMB 1337 = ATCC 19106]